MKVTVLGSGTSTGVPVIGCQCQVCKSDLLENKRTRSSIMIESNSGTRLVIDVTPDFRMQMLRHDVRALPYVLLTHTHADHCHGFDDLRGIYFSQGFGIQMMATEPHLQDIRKRFHYAFEDTGYVGTRPKIEMIPIPAEGEFEVEDLTVECMSVDHGGSLTSVFKIGSFAYATDFKAFTASQIWAWRGRIHSMIASGIHFRPHASHSNIPETIELFKELQVRQGIITHISHEVDHLRDSADLPKSVVLAYDGMTIDVPE